MVNFQLFIEHINDHFPLLYKRRTVYTFPTGSASRYDPTQILHYGHTPVALPTKSDKAPDAGQKDDDSRAGENSIAPSSSTWYIARRGTTQIPAAEIGQFALLRQHGSIRAHIGDTAAE